MKLVSFHESGQTRAGVVVAGRVIDLDGVIATLPFSRDRSETLTARGITVPATGMLRLLYAGPSGFSTVTRHIESLVRARSLDRYPLLEQTALLAPVPRPGKIVGVGRNYTEHAKEVGAAPQERPRIFVKLASSVVGPGSIVARPAEITKMDFEAELAVVIGVFASHIVRTHALEAVAGYTVLNDLSAREFQFDVSPPQTSFAKSMDGFCPMGPWLVTKDEIPDPQALEIHCHVNGRSMQLGRTSEMIFPVDRLIEYISRFVTLEPGDLIATGTPAGVGAFRTPPVWLHPGDRVRIEIPRVGTLEHAIG